MINKDLENQLKVDSLIGCLQRLNLYSISGEIQNFSNYDEVLI